LGNFWRQENVFYQKSTEEFAKLCKMQGALEKETGQSLYAGLSVAETLQVAIATGNARAAANIRSEFKVCQT
jgi:hypothetical protein